MSWRRFAACKTADPATFFPENSVKGKPVDYGPALAICAVCPAIKACRDEHMGEPEGVFGGLTPAMRERIRRKNRGYPATCSGCGATVFRRERPRTNVWCGAPECRREMARLSSRAKRARDGRVA